MLHMFAIIFQVIFICFCMCFKCIFRMSQLFRTYVAITYLNVLKVDRRCYACCNISHLPQPLATAAGAPVQGGERPSKRAGARAGKRGEWRTQGKEKEVVAATIPWRQAL
jgi:hypothetical protein